MKLSRMCHVVKFLTILTFASSLSFAEEAQDDGAEIFDITAGIERMEGDTTYQIGGYIVYADGTSGSNHFPFSELEWPLDVWLGRIDAGLNIGSSWRINGVLKMDLSDPDSNMKDSDWGYWYVLGVPGTSASDFDIYSESSISKFEAFIFDIDVEWAFLQRERWSLFTGLGYQYQNFDFEGQLIQERLYIGGMPITTFIGDGSTSITYEITYSMPYALIGGDFLIGDNFTLSGSFAYAPWVEADDKDNHVLRNRIAEGDMEGDAYMFDMSARYNFTSSWFMVAGFHYLTIDVDGTMTVAVNGVPVISSEDETTESEQISGYVKVGFTF